MYHVLGLVLALMLGVGQVAHVGESVPPLAAVAIDGPSDAVTLDGLSWSLVDDAVVEEAAAAAGSTAIAEVEGSTVLLLGQMPEASETAVFASIASLAVAVAAPSVGAADTHPKMPVDKYKLKKIIRNPETGATRELFKTLEVEQRSGETGPEFNRRSERALNDAEGAGWVSIP